MTHRTSIGAFNMVDRADITDAEYAFLASQKILVSHVYDARGRAATAWGEDAKREGLIFGLAEPCYRGHRLRERAGHCIECNTARIAYARRFAESGYVYIAASKAEKLLKVGSCADPDQRERNLNVQLYGGTGDWEMIAWCKTPSMGQVEFDIQRKIADISTERSYKKDGRDQVARELFRYEINRVWQTYRARVAKFDDKSKWQHPKLAGFAKP